MAADDAPPTSIHDVSDDVLELILQRVSSLVCLTRAASACKRWRRVIADSGFRWLHAPAAVAGYYNSCRWFLPSKKPWTSIQPSLDPLSSSTATGGIDPRHLSLDFLSDDMTTVLGVHDAEILDSRGSLLLIEFIGVKHVNRTFPDALVVCEPLTRRYKKIPRPRDYDGSTCCYWRCFLIDSDGNGGRCISMTNFRVVCEIDDLDYIAHTMVFTAGGGSADDGSWTDKAVNHITPKLNCYSFRSILGRAGGSWYIYIDRLQPGTWFILDGSTGEYSSAQLLTTVDWDLHDSRWKNSFHVTDGCDGKPRVVSLLYNTLKVFARIDDGRNGEWALEKRIDLPESLRGLLGSDYQPPPPLFEYSNVPKGTWPVSLWAKGQGFIIIKLGRDHEPYLCQFFSVDLQTMEVKPAEKYQHGILYKCTLPCPPAALHYTPA